MDMQPVWFGLFTWFFLCVKCATIISALFSGIRRRAEKNNHLSTYQSEIELHDWGGLKKLSLPSQPNAIYWYCWGPSYACMRACWKLLLQLLTLSWMVCRSTRWQSTSLSCWRTIAEALDSVILSFLWSRNLLIIQI